MSCWTKSELENMLEDVVNELDLSDAMIEKHGPLGTAPATLVRLVLEQKNMQIRMLKQGMTQIEARPAKARDIEAEIRADVASAMASADTRCNNLDYNV